MSITPKLRLIRAAASALAVLLPLPAAFAGASPPILAKTFSASEMAVDSSVTLTFTIANPNAATDLTGVGFTDPLPSGLIVANPDSLNRFCDPGTITLSAHSIQLTGATVFANASCVFAVDVYAVESGVQVNVTDPVTSNEGGTGNSATATIVTDVIFKDGFEGS